MTIRRHKTKRLVGRERYKEEGEKEKKETKHMRGRGQIRKLFFSSLPSPPLPPQTQTSHKTNREALMNFGPAGVTGTRGERRGEEEEKKHE